MEQPIGINNFIFSTLCVCFKSTDNVYLPKNQGSTLRGAFGRALETIACRIHSKNCNECFLLEDCSYYQYFSRVDTRTNESAPVNPNAKEPAPVRPYIIEPQPAVSEMIRPGEEIAFYFTIIGRSIDHYKEFLSAFEEMGRRGLGRGRGRCHLDAVYTLIKGDDFQPVYLKTNGRKKISNRPYRQSWEEINEHPDAEVNTIRAKFLTPLRLTDNNHLIDRAPFHVLIHRLIKRIEDLDKEYCGGGLRAILLT